MKPTYEELEAKCALQQSKLEAINKLMGVVETASDIAKAGVAELEARCAALAAENAGLKAICDDRRTFIMNGVQLGYIKVPTVETDPALETIRIAVSPQEITPATDACLAEVRAQGVESVGEYLKQYAQGLHEEARLVLQDAGELCNGYAAQLRKGATE